jgi:hypothetical protein
MVELGVVSEMVTERLPLNVAEVGEKLGVAARTDGLTVKVTGELVTAPTLAVTFVVPAATAVKRPPGEVTVPVAGVPLVKDARLPCESVVVQLVGEGAPLPVYVQVAVS